MSIKTYELPLVFFLGGTVYMLLEILWRGYSHWTMGICGGLCFMSIYLFEIFKPNCHYFFKCAFGAAVITTAEFFTGVIVNLVLGWNVWDYSNLSFNILGQVCPYFTLVWFSLSLPAFWIAKTVRKTVFTQKVKG